jgi:hypothetical protein
LVDKHGTQNPAASVEQAYGWHLVVGVEDDLELLVQVLDCPRTQFEDGGPDCLHFVVITLGAEIN